MCYELQLSMQVINQFTVRCLLAQKMNFKPMYLACPRCGMPSSPTKVFGKLREIARIATT